jgi:hypothetical protein
MLLVRDRIGDHAEQLAFADALAERNVGEQDAAVIDAHPLGGVVHGLRVAPVAPLLGHAERVHQRFDRLGAVLDLFGLHAHRLTHLEGHRGNAGLAGRAT